MPDCQVTIGKIIIHIGNFSDILKKSSLAVITKHSFICIQSLFKQTPTLTLLLTTSLRVDIFIPVFMEKKLKLKMESSNWNR